MPTSEIHRAGRCQVKIVSLDAQPIGGGEVIDDHQVRHRRSDETITEVSGRRIMVPVSGRTIDSPVISNHRAASTPDSGAILSGKKLVNNGAHGISNVHRVQPWVRAAA